MVIGGANMERQNMERGSTKAGDMYTEHERYNLTNVLSLPIRWNSHVRCFVLGDFGFLSGAAVHKQEGVVVLQC